MDSDNYAPGFPMRTVLYLSLLATASAETFHVSLTGDDSALGTQAAPWRTIQRALATEPQKAGHIIEVGPGVYDGPLEIRHGGAWRAPWIVRAADGAEIRMSDAEDAVTIDTDSPVIFEGFTIRPTGGVGVRISGGGHGVVLRSLKILSDGSADGIVVERTTAPLIEGNTISGARHGLVIGGTGAVIRNNTISQNTGAGLILGRDRPAIDVLIRNNSFLENGSSNSQPGAIWFVHSRRVRVENNILTAGAGRRLMTVDSSDAEFSHNLYFTPNDLYGAEFQWGGVQQFGFLNLRLLTGDPFPVFGDPRLSESGLHRSSPAIDAGFGRAGSLELDGSGATRHVGLAVDIGANEFPHPTGLRVLGNQLVHQGRIVRLRGVGVGDPVLDRRERPFSDYRILREKWNANTVRMSVHPYIWRDAERFGGRKAIIEWFRLDIEAALRAGLYVILDWHITGWPNGFARPSEPGELEGLHDSDFELAKSFWTVAAAEFGKNGMVAFELWNEPVRGPDDWKPDPSAWQELRPYMEELTAIVRQHSGNLVIVSGGNWAYCLDGIQDAPPSDPNTALAWHIYAGKEENDEKRWAAAFNDLDQIFPVIVTEWGFDENGVPPYRGGVPDFGERFARNWLEGRKLHWVAWCWHPNVAPPLIKADWKSPTSFGNFVGSLLRSNVRVRHSPPAAFSPTGLPSSRYKPFSIN
jgi:parallel beta-helix repeat protein